MEILNIAYESAVLTAAVIFLLAVASILQYLMGVTGVPLLLGELLKPLESAHWLFLIGVALITMVFGMVLFPFSAASPQLLERADAFLAEHGQDAALCRAVIEGRDVAAKALRARKLPA